jgi:Rrf2 family nitric oxide-sensitive transcriptional repressor
MRLTIRTNLAMRALMFCAVNRGRLVRKHEIAAACNASENHLGVVVNMLGQAGYIETARGRNGGIRLARDPADIPVGDVFRLFEAPVPFTECFAAADNHCPLTCACRLRSTLARAVEAFYATLDGVTLADLVVENVELARLLALDPA